MQELKFGLIGKTLSYSYSKIIHEKLFELAGIDASYDLIEQSKLDFANDYTGYNITIPFKADVTKFMGAGDIVVNDLHVANTVDMRTKLAYNTDALGFISLLPEQWFRNIIILGTGASANLVKYLLGNLYTIIPCDSVISSTAKVNQDILFRSSDTYIKSQSYKAPHITMLSRRDIDDFQYDLFIQNGQQSKLSNQTEIKLDAKSNPKFPLLGTYDHLNFLFDEPSSTLLVNCTPLGIKGFPPHNQEVLKLVNRADAVIDLVYNPLETELIKRAKERNIYYRSGLKMLVVQAVEANVIWGNISDTDKEFYITELENFLQKYL